MISLRRVIVFMYSKLPNQNTTTGLVNRQSYHLSGLASNLGQSFVRMLLMHIKFFYLDVSTIFVREPMRQVHTKYTLNICNIHPNFRQKMYT